MLQEAACVCEGKAKSVMDLSSRDKDCLWDGINKVHSLYDLTACRAKSGLEPVSYRGPSPLQVHLDWRARICFQPSGLQNTCCIQLLPMQGDAEQFWSANLRLHPGPRGDRPTCIPIRLFVVYPEEGESTWQPCKAFVILKQRHLSQCVMAVPSRLNQVAHEQRSFDAWVSAEGTFYLVMTHTLLSIDTAGFVESSWCAGFMSSIRNDTTFTSRPVEVVDSHGEPRTLEGTI